MSKKYSTAFERSRPQVVLHTEIGHRQSVYQHLSELFNVSTVLTISTTFYIYI